LNEFIRQQKEQPGQAVFTLVQFDTEYEFVHRAVPIGNVPKCELLPRGCTALLDAVGRAIVETGERLKGIAEQDRPGLVVFLIVTDGQENSSKEYRLPMIKEMIEHQQSVYQWQFTFLGANQDAFAEAGAMGIAAQAAANYSAERTGPAFVASSNSVGRMRRAAAKGLQPKNAYTDEERKAMS
jgi:hypothetical protein